MKGRKFDRRDVLKMMALGGGMAGLPDLSQIMGQIQAMMQPYDGAHAPLPGASREVFVRLRYDLAG